MQNEVATRRLERMFAAHADQLYAYAAQRVGRDLAGDVVSETFLIAWRRLDAVPVRPLPWLIGTARRVIANERRGLARRSALAERLVVEAGGSVVDNLDAGVESRAAVRVALQKLSETDQEALTLCAWYDLSAREAARVVVSTPGAFAVRLHRARRRLQRELARLELTNSNDARSDEEART